MMRIAVLRALPGLGDVLCATPALRALRTAHPRAEIDVIALERTRALWERLGAEVVAFPGWEGLPEEPYEPERTERFLAEADYDVAFQLHGSGPQSTAFVEALGAREWYAPAPWREDRSEVLWPLDVLAQAGVEADGTELDFPHGGTSPVDGAYAVLHSGSALPDRRWPAERFAAVADALEREGLQPVLTGSAGERDAVDAVLRAVRCTPVDLCGATSLDDLAALVEGAAVLVTNDTGVSHLAAAVRAPSVVCHTVTEPDRWAPLDRDLHVPLVRPQADGVIELALRAAAARSPGSGP